MTQAAMDSELAATLAAAPRIHALSSPARELAESLVGVSVLGLRRMQPGTGRIPPHSLRRRADGEIEAVGRSPRYGAIMLLGSRWLDSDTERWMLNDVPATEVCDALVEAARDSRDLGEAALVAWAAGELDHRRAEEALEHALGLAEDARKSAGVERRSYTVERAWLLSALVASAKRGDLKRDAERAASRLLDSFENASQLFTHRLSPLGGPRAHVACFADQVYPIQALARFHAAFDEPAALSAAAACAERICSLQGACGQWWWHYDVRSGDVLEGYPVYSVHQDAMGPMCLFDLHVAGGPLHLASIEDSLAWMGHAEEIQSSLVDEAESLIWRKVARRDPAKLVRNARAAASHLPGRARLRFLDRWFPPDAIDFECRPYHLGWVLMTWLTRR